VRLIGPGVAEIKRMYVAPRARRHGLGRRLLRELERGAAELGCRTVRLDTMAAMAEAGALYRSAGYEPIADYDGNPLAGSGWSARPAGFLARRACASSAGSRRRGSPAPGSRASRT
jgi:ribosomal protein S18 acetylase RimI-like enzyme